MPRIDWNAVLVVILMLTALLLFAVTKNVTDCPEVGSMTETPEYVVAAGEYGIDEGLAHMIAVKAAEHYIPQGLAFRLVYRESSFNPNAKSWANAVGLTQITPITAEEMGVDHSDMYDPELNLDTGFGYLYNMKERFGDWHTALVAYHVGPTAVARNGKEAYGPSVKYANSIMEGA